MYIKKKFSLCLLFFSFGILMAILISKVKKIHNLKHLESNLDMSFKKNEEDEGDVNNIITVDDEQ